MCTVTWLQDDDGYHLFSSRDEKSTRNVAEPPHVFEHAGTRWISPADSDEGGSWITSNQFGISVCLLNGNGRPGTTSRGLLVRTLAPSRDPSTALQRTRLASFAPFKIAVLAPRCDPRVFEWNGSTLTELTDVALPLASSSLFPAEARSARASLYRKLNPRSVSEAIAFHASHSPDHGPLAPCMHRADASTVSFTHVHVCSSSVQMNYYPQSLCLSPKSHTVQIHALHSSDCPLHLGK